MSSTAIWVNPETGEMVEGPCAYCAATEERCEDQVRAMERERRADRAARTKAENEVEKARTAKRDSAAWKTVLAHYALRFPDKAKAMRSTSVKSERATAFFQRLEAGVTVEDVCAAIDAATVWRWISYGRRVKQPHGQAQPATDLSDILKDDVRFDYLVAHGYEMRAAHEAGSAT